MELLVVVVVAATLIATVAPVAGRAVDLARLIHRAAVVGTYFRHARHRAVLTGAAHGLVFDLTPLGWTVRVCRDGNGDGLLRADIVSLADPCAPDVVNIRRDWPGVEVAVNSSIPGPDGTPPTADPVRFGATDIASFSPAGSATAGTLYLQSGAGIQYAVRVAGTTGRIRVLRFSPATAQWGPG